MYMWSGSYSTLLYISDEHDRALKARVKELGVPEAEPVRQIL